MKETASTGEPAALVQRSSVKLTGAPVAPGLVLGVVHRKDHDLTESWERVPRGDVPDELDRFQRARDRARLQLEGLKERVAGRVGADDARILDTHLTYLRDSAFITDVENLITRDQMRLEAAIAKVIGDFDRIFRLVENRTLRQSAVDLRDVGIRVLRNLEDDRAPAVAAPSGAYVLVARELNIVDMFNLDNEHVRGIATEEGGLTSHAAIFARGMRIPTVTAVAGLLEEVREGDFVLLDATEGTLLVHPDERVRQQYRSTATAAPAEPRIGTVPERLRTSDGEELELTACCGNLPEVVQAAEAGAPRVGLYRTELLFLVEPQAPSQDALREHYASVLAAARGARVTFRLLDVDPDVGVRWLAPGSAAVGAGVRLLLQNEGLLRRQLRALLESAADGRLSLAVPFVTDCGELERVRAILVDERQELRKHAPEDDVEVSVGAVVETPAALIGMRDLARCADFLTVNLDALVGNVLDVDRNLTRSGASFRELHPFVLRALAKLSSVCAGEGRELEVFGASVAGNADVLFGLGLRSFSVAPADFDGFLGDVARLDAQRARESAAAAAAQSWPAESLQRVADYHHGQY